MNLSQLFDALNDRSLHVASHDDGTLEVIGDCRLLTDQMKQSLRDHRDDFLRLLDPPTPSKAAPSGIGGRVRLGRDTHAFDNWGLCERLLSPIAIDCETELIQGNEIPRLALASVSDGTKHRLIPPGDLQAFVDSHAECHFICHNASFDFAVIDNALDDPQQWREITDRGRLHDTMILDALLRLGRKDEEPINRNLGILAKAYLGVVIDKDDPFRLRYGEIIGKDWGKVEAGFFSYAIKDAIATQAIYRKLTTLAKRLVDPFEDQLIPGYRDAWGLLTESLQVRGAIALDQITRNGMTIDRHQVEETKEKLTKEVETLVESIDALPEAEGVFKRSKKGDLQLTATGKPSTDQTKLREILEGIADDLDLQPPRTDKTDRIGTSMKYWNQYGDHSPFLKLWGKLESTNKLCQFFAGMNDDQIHPRYTAIVRTGRTSCRSPNIQQLPRSGGFREMVIPSLGHYFLAIDYAAIELRTLAAVCLRRYGRSQLAEVIKDGIDPHAFTAAMFEAVSIEDFAKLPNKKELRQRAKALNFGIPGGLGAKSLVAYASATYGVKMSIDEASAFREKLIEEVYPELSGYLEDDAIESLAFNLKTTPEKVAEAFESRSMIGAAKRIVAGRTKADGGEYAKGFSNRIWITLSKLNRNSRLRSKLKKREASDQLSRDLFFGPVATLTGRIRGSVGFSQARNTPFQGLAADGAKLALWGLYLEGYRCVAFVHDEVIIEIPVEADHTAEAEKIDQILCRSMEQLTGDIPIACEYALMDRWYKQAEAVFEGGKLKLWEPGK